MRIIVTGGMGCGKSTVVKLLRERLPPNYEFISYDKLVEELYAVPKVIAALNQQFGVSTKEEISNKCFSDATGETLKAVQKTMCTFLDSVIWAKLRNPNLVFEFPMYFEQGDYTIIDNSMVVCVTCDPEIQMERIKSRDKITKTKILAKLANQINPEIKQAFSDYVIDWSSYDMANDLPQLDQLVEKIYLQDLKYRAFETFGDRCEDLWDTFISRFKLDPSRHYHNINHIAAMFKEFDKHEAAGALNYPLVVSFAIWFHDWVYNTRSQINEYKSIQEMYKLAKQYPARMIGRKSLGCGTPVLAAAAQLILSTKTHNVDDLFYKNRPQLLSDAKIFLDIDMMILACDDIYEYDRQIEEEYAHVPFDLFKAGRLAFLHGTLAKPKIFLSTQYKHLEEKARSNIQLLIEKWEQL